MWRYVQSHRPGFNNSNEDCLYINMYVPQVRPFKHFFIVKSVMVVEDSFKKENRKYWNRFASESGFEYTNNWWLDMMDVSKTVCCKTKEFASFFQRKSSLKHLKCFFSLFLRYWNNTNHNLEERCKSRLGLGTNGFPKLKLDVLITIMAPGLTKGGAKIFTFTHSPLTQEKHQKHL